ncbi:MAG TPA: hypothetical protein PLD59_01795 [Tepidisphaeraceae bacterium]|nr:hypothetical protein [Tepidisphaeraceae bacterium]
MNRRFAKGDIVQVVSVPPNSPFPQAVGMSGFIQELNDYRTRACFMGLDPHGVVTLRSLWLPCSCLEIDNSIESRAAVVKYFVKLTGRSAMAEISKAGPEFLLAVEDLEKRLNVCMSGLNTNPQLAVSINTYIWPRMVHLLALALQVRTNLPEEVFDSLIPVRMQK